MDCMAGHWGMGGSWNLLRFYSLTQVTAHVAVLYGFLTFVSISDKDKNGGLQGYLK
jgi:hypothetical protein